jgi:hypothetical protein
MYAILRVLRDATGITVVVDAWPSSNNQRPRL